MATLPAHAGGGHRHPHGYRDPFPSSERDGHVLPESHGDRNADHDRHALAEKFKASPTGAAPQYKTVEQGAATSVWAATAPELEGQGALYLEDCHIAKLRSGPADEGGYEAYALDPELAKKLWAVSEEMVGERFPLAR